MFFNETLYIKNNLHSEYKQSRLERYYVHVCICIKLNMNKGLDNIYVWAPSYCNSKTIKTNYSLRTSRDVGHNYVLQRIGCVINRIVITLTQHIVL